MTGLDQTMRDIVLFAYPIETMTAGGIALASGAAAIRKLLAIVCQHFMDIERGLFD